jgi:hypothetical protein
MSPPKYSYRSGPAETFRLAANTSIRETTVQGDKCRTTFLGAFSALGPAPRWWREPIPWYPDVAFGPYRKMELHGGYSRRELAFDAAIHALGVFLGMDKAHQCCKCPPRGGVHYFIFHGRPSSTTFRTITA